MASSPAIEAAPVRRTLAANLIMSWAVLGVLLLVGRAVVRIVPVALEPLADNSMNGWQIALYVGWCIWMLYGEGYRGFQKGFSPRVVGRAVYAGNNPTPLRVILAPLFAMAFFGATRKRMIVSYSLVSGIVCLVLLVRLVPQPYRGIVDGGVVLGLAWGLASLLVFYVRALLGRPPQVEIFVPDRS